MTTKSMNAHDEQEITDNIIIQTLTQDSDHNDDKKNITLVTDGLKAYIYFF